VRASPCGDGESRQLRGVTRPARVWSSGTFKPRGHFCRRHGNSRRDTHNGLGGAAHGFRKTADAGSLGEDREGKSGRPTVARVAGRRRTQQTRFIDHRAPCHSVKFRQAARGAHSRYGGGGLAAQSDFGLYSITEEGRRLDEPDGAVSRRQRAVTNKTKGTRARFSVLGLRLGPPNLPRWVLRPEPAPRGGRGDVGFDIGRLRDGSVSHVGSH